MIISLSHPSIVNYDCCFFNEGCLWLVMEYCDGGSLSDIMTVLKRPLDESELSSVLHGVLRSLEYVHSLNRVHRDIKSGNLLLTSEGVVKLCDFGVSGQLADALMRTSARLPPILWMAPEVVTNQGDSTKGDIWSFGITALELLVGPPPLCEIPGTAALLRIPLNPPPAPPPDSSDRLQAFVRRTLVKDPDLRPTATELLQDDFITQTSDRAGAEVLRNLVNRFITAKREADDREVEEEYTEEEAGGSGSDSDDLGDDLTTGALN
jgi:serine/threonine protein kinase